VLRPLPDFIIIGAQKCGTTFLYETLGKHPRVRAADEKEIHFFDSSEFKKGMKWYRSHFPVLFPRMFGGRLAKLPLTGEASPYYLIYPHAARRIAAAVPRAKLLVLLRNPVDRAYSHHSQKSRKWETLSFEEAIDAEEQRMKGEREKILEDEHYRSAVHKHFSYLERGVYIDQLQHYAKYFSREQMLVIKSEEMFENTPQVFKRVLDFLGLPHWQPEKFAPANIGRYDEMKPETRQRLNEYFAPHNQRLYEYLGEDFDW
jgi:hypothetical protein